MRSGRWRLIALGVAGAFLVAGLIVGLSRRDGSPPVLIRGGPALEGTAPAPPVAGPELESGARIDLAGYRGRPTIINVWASWCGPCRDEAPAIKRFTEERPDVAFLGVNLNDPRASARKFEAEVGWTHPSIYDPSGRIGFDALRVLSLPVTIYVDARGRIRGRTQGTVTYEDLVSVAERIQ